MKTVIVVESPAKARKIKTFFKDDTIVTSSFGHIIDLPAKHISIDIENDFKPTYKPINGKGKIIKELAAYSEGYRILLAADDDREGDAIAWHCGNTMKVNFEEKNRIIFHEISKKAIYESIDNVHKLNMNSVNAQQGRRILDRLVGYSLSPLLWKNIDSKVKGLSAGRVQSTLLLILKENEDKILNHESTMTYGYQGSFTFSSDHGEASRLAVLHTSLTKVPNIVLNDMKKNRSYRILRQYHKEEKKYPGKPFITSSLQQAAQNELGFSVKVTMNIAQKLYENGKITYMRTDSCSVSQDFQDVLKDHITSTYDSSYYQSPQTGRKVKGAQEAHECIRTTSLQESLNSKYSECDRKLYSLIKKRTITSHMRPATYDNLIYELSNDDLNGYFEGKDKALIDEGYLIYSDPTVKTYDKISDLPDEIYHLKSCICSEINSSAAQFPNESSIVKKLEKSGIGRPSTYASLIATLYNRKYTVIQTIKGKEETKKVITLHENDEIVEEREVVRQADQKKRIVLTPLGKQVLKYLMSNFSIIINVEFTALVERELDRVNDGEISWETVVGNVYDSFKDSLIIQRGIKIMPSGKDVRERDLGSLGGESIILKDGKFGPYVSYKKKNRGLSYLLKDIPTEYDDITLDFIKDYIQYPLSLGKHDGSQVMIHIGPYGKYMKYGKRNIKIPQNAYYELEACIRLIPRY